MSQLPERVKVYPTENYYYFGFFHNGIRYAGNIRLDASNRDDGKADLRVFRGHRAVVSTARRIKHADARCRARRDGREGRAARLSRDSYQGKSVMFALNDLRNVKPPAGALGPDEKFIGPIFDEFAIRFLPRVQHAG